MSVVVVVIPLLHSLMGCLEVNIKPQRLHTTLLQPVGSGMIRKGWSWVLGAKVLYCIPIDLGKVWWMRQKKNLGWGWSEMICRLLFFWCV